MLETTPVILSKLSNVVKNENDVSKMTEYNELVKKINPIQTTDTTVMDKIYETNSSFHVK